jgi:hypothetical protein
LASASNDVKAKEEIAADLRLLYVKWESKIGGRYRDSFEDLRRQVAPDNPLPVPTTQAK